VFLFRAFALAAAIWAPAVLSADVVITHVGPFSGSQGQRGPAIALGAKLYFDYINERGGVNGNKLVLKSRDDGYEPAKTVSELKAAIDQDSPIAMFSPIGTSNMAEIVKAKVLEESGLPIVGFGSGPFAAHQPVNPLLFHTRAHYRDEAEKMVEQMVTTGITKIAVLYQDDGFGKDGLAGVEGAQKKFKFDIVTKATFERNTTKVEGAVAQIKKADPQGIILVSNTAPSAEFVKQAKAAGMGAQMMAISVTDGVDVAKRIGKDKAIGLGISQVLPNPYKRTLPIVGELNRLYEKSDKKVPLSKTEVPLSYTVMEGFLNAKVLVEGLRRAGPKPTREKLVSALETMTNYDAGGFTVSFGKGVRSGSRYVELSVVNAAGGVSQ
jgi:branched-chain amino acid transport system substrate-binding protein